MKTKRNLWPWGILTAFVLFFCGTVALIVMAASQTVDLVSGNYYDQEIKYQHRIDSSERASQLGDSFSVSYDPARRGILLRLPAQHAGRVVSGTVELYRPSAAGLDRRMAFHPDNEGCQWIDGATLSSGLWKVRVSWKVDGAEYYLEKRVVIQAHGNSESRTQNPA